MVCEAILFKINRDRHRYQLMRVARLLFAGSSFLRATIQRHLWGHTSGIDSLPMFSAERFNLD